MTHYRLYFTNPNFYIADASVNALIRFFKRLDPNLKVSRGKIQNGHIIYFDSEVNDFRVFRGAMEKFIKDKKYEFHQYRLEVIKNSGVGVSESLNNLISFDKFNIE